MVSLHPPRRRRNERRIAAGIGTTIVNGTVRSGTEVVTAAGQREMAHRSEAAGGVNQRVPGIGPKTQPRRLALAGRKMTVATAVPAAHSGNLPHPCLPVETRSVVIGRHHCGTRTGETGTGL
ncbi:PREDICTED: uncharacterized protein LOC104515905 [Eurypyga helias]|uniref:uncharacterized protein LOC104515905 n=1 Tax=Eurypyga helias TaxID=54383 RepID=UPI000528C026|nr:PREDICTED: uncharacterized protein LOC104515905 [Eurypyga helias]